MLCPDKSSRVRSTLRRLVFAARVGSNHEAALPAMSIEYTPGPLLDAARNTPPPCKTIRQISPILRPNGRSCTSWHSRPPTAASWASVSVAFPSTIPTRSLWRSTTKRLTPLRFHVAFHRLQPGARHSLRDGLLSEIRSISPYVNAHIEHEVAEYRNVEVPQISASTFLKDAEELSRYRLRRSPGSDVRSLRSQTRAGSEQNSLCV